MATAGEWRSLHNHYAQLYESAKSGFGGHSRHNMGCIPPGKIVMVDDPPQYIYWSKPQNPDYWKTGWTEQYSTNPIAVNQAKPRGKFEELLDRFDDLYAEF